MGQPYRDRPREELRDSTRSRPGPDDQHRRVAVFGHLRQCPARIPDTRDERDVDAVGRCASSLSDKPCGVVSAVSGSIGSTITDPSERVPASKSDASTLTHTSVVPKRRAMDDATSITAGARPGRTPTTTGPVPIGAVMTLPTSGAPKRDQLR